MTAAASSLGLHPNNLRKRVDVDLQGERQRSRPVPIAGHHFEAARQAAFDMAYLERRDWRADDVVRAFFDEAFEEWIEAKLAALQNAKRKP